MWSQPLQGSGKRSKEVAHSSSHRGEGKQSELLLFLVSPAQLLRDQSHEGRGGVRVSVENDIITTIVSRPEQNCLFQLKLETLKPQSLLAGVNCFWKVGFNMSVTFL